MWNNTSPLYKQVAIQIQDHINASNLSKDDAIPTENMLMDHFKVSRVTIRKAIETLVDKGILYKVHGSGTYLSHDKIEHDIFKLQGFTQEMEELNSVVSNKVLDFKMINPQTEVQEVLNIEANEKVYYIKRLRLADDEPLVLEISFLPVKLFPELSIHIMEHSKYEYIEEKGYKIDKRYGELKPILPTEEISDLFHLNKQEPLLFLHAHSTFDTDTVFEYSEVFFHPNKYAFKFVSAKG